MVFVWENFHTEKKSSETTGVYRKIIIPTVGTKDPRWRQETPLENKLDQAVVDFLDECLEKDVDGFSELMRSRVVVNKELRSLLDVNDVLFCDDKITPFDVIRMIVKKFSGKDIFMLDMDCSDLVSMFCTEDEL